jgi:hypothetical protein
MNSARFLVAILVLAGAVLAACSGNFGSGTTPPNGLLPSGPLSGINPTPTPTPNSANNIVTYGDSTAFQPLPNAAGWGGAIAFPVPSPRPSGFDSVAIGATVAVVAPTDAPDLNLLGKGQHARHRERRARSLVYITLLPTHDVTLSAFPRIAIDVPRDIVATYKLEDFGLALYNAGEKDTAYRLGVAPLDTGATPPPTPSPPPSAPPPPTAIPLSASAAPSGAASASATVAASAAPTGSAPPTPNASPTLPPQRIVFVGTAETLKLTANRPVVFAFYALPKPEASGSPGPAGSGSPAASAAPEATASATAAPSPGRS